jgi:SAM-dependent methyltransferase
MIRHLERVIPSAPGRKGGIEDGHPMRRMTERLAADPASWDADARRRVVELFDRLSGEWHTRISAHRDEPLIDALDRGGPLRGPTVDIGSGIGISTDLLATRIPPVLSLDLSMEMLRLAPSRPGCRLQADAARLPLPDGAAATAVLVNAFLFGPELDRVLAPDGAVVWVNSSGDRTPIHLTAEAVERSLPGAWDGVTAEAGWGMWAVLRRRG